MPVNSRMSEEGESWYDPTRSHLYTTMTGTIHPGEDPVFRLAGPIEYDLSLVPGRKPD